MKRILLFPLLFLVLCIQAQYSTGFEDWPIQGEGSWSLSGPGGTYTSQGCYVNFGNEANGLRKVGFNTSGDRLSLPAVDNPSSVSFWARLSSGSGAYIDVRYFNGSDWVTAASHRISSTSYDYFRADIDYIGSNVPLRLVMSTYGNSVFLDDLSVGAFILPVELGEFTTTFQKDEGVTLHWSTLSESNNLGFDIERSQDASTFKVIGHVGGAGTSGFPKHYRFLDPVPYPGLFYYRLRQIDFDGTSSYSPLRSVMVTMEPESVQLQLGATIVSNTLQVHLKGPPVMLELSILDRHGNLMRKIPRQQINNQYSINISPLSSGLYFLQMRWEDQRLTRRFIKM